MRKTVLILITALFAFVGSVSADEFVVPDFKIAPGETKFISVELDNPGNQYIAFEFWMQLPEGIEIATDENGILKVELNKTRAPYHDLEVKDDGDGVYHFLCYAGPSVPDDYKIFQGESGELFSMLITASEDLELGEELQGNFFTQKLSDPNEEKLEFPDATFNITIGITRVEFDENAERLPYFEAGTKKSVSIIRTINTDEWSTLVLPFTMTQEKVAAAFGSDVKLAQFDGFKVEYDEDDDDDVTPNGITLRFSTYTLSRRNSLKGGNLYLIKLSNPIDYFEADEVTMTGSVTDVNKDDDDEYGLLGKFTGSFVKTKVPANGLFLYDNKFWYSTGKTNIKGFRGWFELDAVLGQETDFGANINFVVDDEPTSVDGIPAVVTCAKGAVYNLQGQYLGNDISIKNLPSGIYIVDGKKMVIK